MKDFPQHSLKVILAAPRGFCAGVNMAIECLELSLDLFGAPIYVYHEIVHNKHVVESFKGRGVQFVNSIEEVPPSSLLLYSAHGVSPALRTEAKDKKLRTIDATCPLVTKVHVEALTFAKQGFHIILIGHAGHDEVIGTMGEAPQSISLVETPEEVEALPFSRTDRLAFLTQTTLSIDDAARIIEVLKKKFPQIVGPKKEDICYATTNRQEVVRQLCPQADVVIVIGSQNSSNSQRLKEIAEAEGKPAYLIDQASELDAAWIASKRSVLITAGASAPEKLVQELVERLQNEFGATVETAKLREEKVHFSVPKELLLAEQNRKTSSVKTLTEHSRN